MTERYGIKARKGIVKVSSLIWVSFLRLQIHLNHEITDFNIISVGASAALLSKVNKCRTFRKNQGFEPEPEPERAKSCKKNRNRFLYILPSVFLRRTTSLSLSSLSSKTSLSTLVALMHPVSQNSNCNPHFIRYSQLNSKRTSKEPPRSRKSLRLRRTSQTAQNSPRTSLRTIKTPKIHRTLTRTLKRTSANLIHLNSCLVKTFRSEHHAGAVKRSRLLRSQDVEEHPGPIRSQATTGKGNIEVTSLNVRGLNDPVKLRHLINHCYNTGLSKNKDAIFCFQETFIENAGMIPFLWRGNFYLTPGRGNSSGCLTLLSHHVNVIQGRSIGERAHVLACQKTDERSVSFIIANVYAPNVNNNEKIEFFNQLFDTVSEFETTYNCKTTLVMGDLNLIFNTSEAKNRNYSAQERNVARAVAHMVEELQLTDSSNTLKQFTWRRPNSDTFSTIDRLLYSGGSLLLRTIKTNWALSLSDHAAIEATFQPTSFNNRSGPRLTRLDASLLDDPSIKEQIEIELRTLMADVPDHWDPHLKLEFMKMCLRTVFEKAQSDRKKKEVSQEHFLNLELDLAIKSLARENLSVHDRAELLDHVEELRVQKEILVENKGKRLAEKLGTKWYNEGEKSTRYFLRLINRSNPDNFKELIDEQGNTCSTEPEIEEEICKFYKNLYENYDGSVIESENDDNFFNELQALSGQDENYIVAPIDLDELLRTLKTCKESAPGPDGISYNILKKLWNTTGPIMVEAWRYTLSSGKLPPSHKTSVLKLIPKAGKDLKKLTNWRPITLSNCDHKLFTKVYSNRMCDRIAASIGENQTAYLKGRLINENIRALVSNIRTANSEDNIDSLIISLDAKKAFDSVEHSYIEKCLEHFGISRFIPIFRILYSDLRSDIIINGSIRKGFNIKRGVKQGDALSCVLFIMCIEPLLRNIEKNNRIEPITSGKLQGSLPKTFAYADDVSCSVLNKPECVQEIFNEYQRLTRMSGLQLNADKTELLHLKSNNLLVRNPSFRIQYCRQQYILTTKPEVKVNGVLLMQDENQMRLNNVDAVYRKIDSQLKSWSKRSLSVLGKILIVKTFGVSQVIFLMQSMTIKEPDFKKLNSLLYKFIWNRHYLAAKAPERIRREIVNKNIRLGGLGMLDIEALDKGLKVRTLGRINSTSHPMSLLLKNQLNLEDFFYPKDKSGLDPVISKGIELLGEDRRRGWKELSFRSNRIFVHKTKVTKLSQALSANGKNSIAFLNLRVQGKTLIGHLNRAELESLSRFLPRELLDFAVNTINLPMERLDSNQWLYPHGKALVDLASLTSKQIRNSRENPEPICDFKIGPSLRQIEVINWSHNLSKLTNTRHKDVLLRLIHGELYSKERLHRYGLVQSPTCHRCDQIENLQHKYFDCPYSREIWRRTLLITDTIRSSVPNEPLINRVMALPEPNRTTLTLHAEVLLEIRRLKDENYLTLPKIIIRKAVERLIRREKEVRIKNELSDLLNHC